MDQNKLQVLRDLDYKINPTCGLCVFRDFEPETSAWGTCKVNTYKHEKHTDNPRQLSVHRAGSCDKYILDRYCALELGDYYKFAVVLGK